ncbi:glycoside hydrolase family 43 protein [Hymenobacter negativus]|uniref:Glycoside hydrolase family 43 protein n=1 Tax=Hymenobacter negativus TaxID=2795026 RepID=A0ABS0Q9Q8_9BACT|nr:MULTISPECIES: glycoside hydrolase family 43 protein [Bacteria]MBH8558939.1 glycoside hydrolase family 43 protein [Hymenobacter negativus]MBH8567379.1 glycoside hydrolase family 43 protein [Hymenobacter negativus]MBR7207111.1 glycoside hydrolase family 43 protein [Microvirga sp. STS02]
MKHFAFSALLASLAGPACAQTELPKNEALIFCYFKNNGQDGLHLASSRDGHTWTALKHDSTFLRPTVSQDRLMRDPCILRGADGLFHMVWTVSWQDKGIGYASSKDLIHWSEQRFLPVMAHEPGTRNTWAPEITYDPATKTYLIYWASTVTGKFPETQRPEEKGYNHRIYATSTKDFQAFTPTKLLYEPGFNVIDASIQPDGRRYVMFLKDETREPVQKNLRVAFADKLAGPYGPASAPITGRYWAEGPTAIRLGADWLVYFDKYREHKYGAVKSTDLMHWTDVSEQIKLPAGLRHGTIFRVSAKELKRLEQQ